MSQPSPQPEHWLRIQLNPYGNHEIVRTAPGVDGLIVDRATGHIIGRQVWGEEDENVALLRKALAAHFETTLSPREVAFGVQLYDEWQGKSFDEVIAQAAKDESRFSFAERCLDVRIEKETNDVALDRLCHILDALHKAKDSAG